MWADLLVLTPVNQQFLAGLREKRLCQDKLWFFFAGLTPLCRMGSQALVSQGCLQEDPHDLHVRGEGLQSRSG